MSTLNTLRTSGPYFTGEESLPYIREVKIGYTIDEMKTIKTGESEFERLIKSDSLYVDKSMYIHLLLRMGQSYYFAARPRRYGKSLFCSTLQALFEGRRELFEGLYIAEKADYSFEKHPVIHLNFANITTSTLEGFLASFREVLRKEGERHGIALRDREPALMLGDLLSGTGNGTVLIIDEYDAPLVRAVTEGKQFISDMRSYFRDFYSRVKNGPEHIRFLFITGVTKYPSLSIFSEMNNLTDISMDPRFASAFGYTEDELLGYFGEAIDEHYEENRDRYGSRDELVERIREYYDGYRFSPDTEITVYNPVSIGRFFNNGCRFDNYWDQTGVSSLAVKLARKYDLISMADGTIDLGKNSFTAFDISLLSEGTIRREYVYALLYYTGYLTIESGDEFGLTLRFPNREVASSFTRSLASMYTDSDVGTIVYEASTALSKGNIASFISIVNRYMASFPYQFFDRRNERVFHLIFHSLLVALGGMVYAEDAGKDGRADEVFEKGKRIYIFELKVDGSADEALAQIRDRKYGGKYEEKAERKGMEIIHLGISFSSKDRQIAEWKSES